jgi:uncharacterized protein
LRALYVTSSAAGTGKTCIAAGIANLLLTRNRKAGYLRPGVAAQKPSALGDAAMVKRFLGLAEETESLAPVFPDETGLSDGIRLALAGVPADKDTVIIEGPSGLGRLASEVALSTGAGIIGVEAFGKGLAAHVPYYAGTGKALVGIILNRVPASRMARVGADFGNAFPGTKLLGAVGEIRPVMSLSTAELAEEVGGRILNSTERSSDLFENIMLGAMSPDHGPDYYGLKPRKAVIVRGDRPDMQLAALETPTTCLVLAGGKAPVSMVLQRAEAKKVPIIVSSQDVKTIVAAVEAAVRRGRLTEARMAAVARLVADALDSESLFRTLS